MKKNIFPLPLILMFAFLALLAGLWAGLLRLGWVLPDIKVNLSQAHGTLMISGFLGTVISLERVVALKKPWMYAAPLLTGLGWMISLALPKTAIGPLMITAGSLVMVLILGVMVRREAVLHIYVMSLGAVSWLVGNLLWLSGMAIFQVVLWWAAFLIFTITGERLELSRVLRMTPLKKTLFLIGTGLFLAGVILHTFVPQAGARLAGFGMLGLAVWLIRFDLARRNLRHPLNITRYIARCLYIGYFWLGFAGILSLWYGAVVAGPVYDAVLHSIFVGFTISMIFGHAPIILPALLNRTLPYHPSFYLSLFLLHTSLLMRVGGNLGGWYELRKWGGLVNEISILLFLAILVVLVRLQPRHMVGGER